MKTERQCRLESTDLKIEKKAEGGTTWRGMRRREKKRFKNNGIGKNQNINKKADTKTNQRRKGDREWRREMKMKKWWQKITTGICSGEVTTRNVEGRWWQERKKRI